MAHNKTYKREALEMDSINPHALVSFRAIVSGLLIAMFTMIGLLGLGLAFGGINMNEDTSAQSAGIFTGIWFIISALISVLLGSYFAARVSKFRTGRVGSAQGLVIAALFLGFFLYQTIAAIGPAGSGVASLLGKSGSVVAQGAQMAANNPTITNSVSNMTENALGDLNLKSSPQDVAQGLATRLILGDKEGAKNYLSIQAGITSTEADTRIAQMKGQVDQFVSDVKEATGTALKSVGWSLFLLVVLCGISGIAGGALGSVANFRRPLVREYEGAGYYDRNNVHA